jgi:NTP pyrophosphatase (non-canonical NTP hydrolase)
MKKKLPVELPERATMADYQRYVHALETHHGWLDVDLVHNCFLMGEEVGELFKAVRKLERYYDEPPGGAADVEPEDAEADRQARERARAHVGEEIVDVFNYLCAIANRLDIDLEEAFVRKNTANLGRVWTKRAPKDPP